MITVLLADGQEMVRTGFRLILGAEDGITVVGEAGTGIDAVAQARRLRPDVVLVDIRMPDLDGLEATRALMADPEPPRIVVVTTFDLDEYVYGALRAGACGFLLKDAGPRLLVEAVRAAANGDALVSPSVTVRLLQHLASRPPSESTGPLSPRELEVVRAVARNRVEIAAWAWEHGQLRRLARGGQRISAGTATTSTMAPLPSTVSPPSRRRSCGSSAAWVPVTSRRHARPVRRPVQTSSACCTDGSHARPGTPHPLRLTALRPAR